MPAGNENTSEAARGEEHQRDAKLAALRSAIDAGDESGFTDGNPLDRIRQSLKLTR
jgi:hypothetical protein